MKLDLDKFEYYQVKLTFTRDVLFQELDLDEETRLPCIESHIISKFLEDSAVACGRSLEKLPILFTPYRVSQDISFEEDNITFTKDVKRNEDGSSLFTRTFKTLTTMGPRVFTLEVEIIEKGTNVNTT